LVAVPLLVKLKLLSSLKGCLKACGLAETLTENLGSLLFMIEGTHYFF
jgi:hypothetical protein